MKQKLSKVLLAALVVPTIIGGATVSHAAEENSSTLEHNQAIEAQDEYAKAYENYYKEDDVIIEDLDTVKENAKKELKENGVESDFFLKEVDKAKTKEGVESLKGELLESHKNSKKEESKEEEKPSDKKEEDKTDKNQSIPLTKIEDIAKPNKKEEEKETPSKENNEVGFSSKEKAEKAAKKALENDEINKSFTISEKDGKFFYALSPAEDLSDVKEKEEDKKEEKPFAKLDEKADEKSFDFDKGFKNKEDAIKQAEILIKNSKINKGYNVSEGADGRYYIQLTPEATKTEGVERKEIKKEDKKEGAKEDKKEQSNGKEGSQPARRTNSNVQTGVGALTGVSMTLISAAAALKKTKRK